MTDVTASDYRLTSVGQQTLITFIPTGRPIAAPMSDGVQNQIRYDIGQRNNDRAWYVNADGSWRF